MTHCSAPWHSLLIKTHGGVFPDNQFTGGYGNIHRDDLTTLWNSEQARAARSILAEGGVPEACGQCALKEQSVGHSRRKYFKDVLDPILKEPSFDPQAEPDIYYLEINASNLCNLKCVMCNGQVSSAWIKDERKLAALDPVYERPALSRIKFTQGDASWLSNLFKEPRYFRNLSYLSLRGGEPFQDPANLDMLRFFIDNGTAKNIVLDIGTNGTIYDEEFCALFDAFKQVKLNISVEATGELYQYIRGGKHFRIEDLEANVRRFSKHGDAEIYFVTLAMAYNVWDMDNLRDWITSIRQPNHRATFKNIVVNPRYLDPHLLPLEMREAALVDSRPTPALIRYEEETHDTGYTTMISSLLRETMDTDTKKLLTDQFRAFTRDLDAVRRTSITSIVPHLGEMLRFHNGKYSS